MHIRLWKVNLFYKTRNTSQSLQGTKEERNKKKIGNNLIENFHHQQKATPRVIVADET